MTLIRKNQNWLPFALNDLFERDFEQQETETAPAINVKETKTGFEIEVAAPAMTKENFVIRIDEDNNLEISAEKKTESEVEDKEIRYLRREFGYQTFSHTLVLPENADKEAIAAKMEHGVLTITVPKISEDELKKAQRLIEIV
ncbi:MAG: Hsp20/alpha crystallin family protein [Prevotellaceae bacterium]|jgi:HSP20 family protein|nr:Hsp20/alpha crystallin family protein [Prevotellaceae bacterium]